jgi:hypothetical protein
VGKQVRDGERHSWPEGFAVGPRAGQFTKISDLFSGMRQYRTLGLVWFDKVQNDGIYHQDWRIENDPQAEAAFRLGLSELNLVRP